MRITKVLLAAVLMFSSSAAFARGGHGGGGGHSSSRGTGSSPSSHAVRGYTKRDGTHVAGYRATNPNGTQKDNYSAKGNVNPSNGKVGTKEATR